MKNFFLVAFFLLLLALFAFGALFATLTLLGQNSQVPNPDQINYGLGLAANLAAMVILVCGWKKYRSA